MANKFQALLALLGKNKQAQGGGQAPINSQHQGLAQLLPPLDINALAQRNGTQTVQQALGQQQPQQNAFQQQHPLLSGMGQGIKKGANKVKHYLLDPVYNTPTGDAQIDATDPRKLTDSRLGRFAVNAVTGLAQQYQNPDNPLAGAFGAYSAGTRMREGDLKEYQARLGSKATVDAYKQAGIQYNPLMDEKTQSKLTDLQIKNKERLAGLKLLANPNATAQYASNGQQKRVDPVTGQVTYTASVEANEPYAVFADPSLLAGKQQRYQQQQNQQAMRQQGQQRINETAKYHNQQLLLGNKRLGLSQAQMAQQERHFQQNFGLSSAKFAEAKRKAKESNPRALSEKERLLENGVITEQQYVNAVMGNPKTKYGEIINVPIQPKKTTSKATPKQEEAKKALLRTPQGGYKTSVGTLPAINLTIGR